MGQTIADFIDKYGIGLYIPRVHITDIIEVLILTFLIYQIIIWIKNTKAWMLLRGIIVLAGFILLAAIFKMQDVYKRQVYDVAFEGLIRNVERRYRETSSETMKAEYEEFMNITPCSACKGQRLKPGALAVTVGDKNISELTGMSIEKLQTFLKELKLSNQQLLIGGQILKEINSRIQFLMDVGLNYLTLGRDVYKRQQQH